MKRPLVILIIFFLFGITVSNTLFTFPPEWLAKLGIPALILVLLLAAASIKSSRLFYSVLCLFFFLLGIFRYSASIEPGKEDISYFLDASSQKALVHGTVTNDPESKDFRHMVFLLKAEQLLSGGEEHAVTGSVRVDLFNPREVPIIGDKIVVGGKLSLPKGKMNPAGFDYKRYLSHMGVHAVILSSKSDDYMRTGIQKGPVISMRRAISSARRKADKIISMFLAGEAKSITRSVILGLRGGIDDATNDIFVKTGTMHILAVSGLHIGIVGMVILGLLRLVRLPRNASYVITILGICAFAIFAGSRPSSVRAAIMGSFILVGLLLGRKTDVVNSLILSAFLITFFKPGQLFMPGFILSYLAVLCIIYITPFTDELLRISQKKLGEPVSAVIRRYFLKALSVSIAVWIGMMPVIASYFHIITPSVIFANLVAIPLLSVVIILGFVALALGTFALLAPAAALAAGILGGVITLLVKTLQVLSSLPMAFVRVPALCPVMISVFYAALAGIILVSRRAAKRKILFTVFILFAALLFVWNEAAQVPQDSLKVTFFDTGKADAILMEFPDRSVAMIDGGEGGKKTGIDTGRDIIAPYLWQQGIRKIDSVILTHAHSDHIGGLLYVLRNFKTNLVIDGGDVDSDIPEKELYEKFLKIIKTEDIKHMRVKRGDILKGFYNMDIAVLNPPENHSYGDLNNDSVVIKATTRGNNSIIFCADAESKAIEGMLGFGTFLRSDIMKVPHHGQGVGDKNIAKEFFDKVGCRQAVITNKNTDRLNKDILEELLENGAEVYITGLSGAIIATEIEQGFVMQEYYEDK